MYILKYNTPPPKPFTQRHDNNTNSYFCFMCPRVQNLHAELERCEPRVVSLLEAADWLRQANEKTGVTRVATDQTVVDSHARLSHLRTRLTALITMTASHVSRLGTVLGYDVSSEDGACIRLHQVKNDSTRFSEENRDPPAANPSDTCYDGQE